MKQLRVVKIILVLLILALAGCASKPTEPLAKLVVRKIAILPVRELTKASLENQNGVQYLFPISAAGFAIDSRAKQKLFSEKIIARKMTIGSDLTRSLTDALTRAGYQVVVLDGIARPPNDPEDIDLGKIATDADAVLQVYFDDVGLFSSRFSTDYLPRVNVRATLHSTRRDEDFYDDTICYGVDARSGKAWAIPADPRFAYPSFDDVMARLPEVAEVFAVATQAIGKHLVAQIKTALE